MSANRARLPYRRLIVPALATALACALPFFLGNYHVFQITLVLVYAIALLIFITALIHLRLTLLRWRHPRESAGGETRETGAA